MFIVIEGSDGVGKGTQVRMLTEWLSTKGFDVWQTKEPTDGEYGRRIRRILGGEESMLEPTEFQMLFVSDRVEHSLEIAKQLKQGKTVVCDRYYYTTFAYGAAVGADMALLRQANEKFPKPDLMLWLNLNSNLARTRMEERGRLDAYDRDSEFQNRLEMEYQKLVDELPEAVEIDASGSPMVVHRQIQAEVMKKLSI